MAVDLFSCDCECGCAAKVPADSLRAILDGLDLPSSPNLLVGPETLDDAGIYQLPDGTCLVQTVDYFPPVARDPYDYGQIAAANSLSDVFAMGGHPLTALAIVCFPAESMAPEVLEQITKGAVDKLKETGCLLLGGHSVVDPQPKYGLSVTGVVDRDEIMDNAHAEPGDVLILTKPLGTGVTIMAAKAGIASPGQELAANKSMATLNAKAAELAVKHGIKACTDVTGFGLLGHSLQMAQASKVAMEINLSRIPFLEGVQEFAAMGLLPGNAYANRKYVGDSVTFGDGVELAQQDLLFDPQTSGGLLLAAAPDKADQLLGDLRAGLQTGCGMIGTVTEKSGPHAIIVTV